ncbi:MAG: metallophosphoesterase [Woeseiaceae bacterium]|nr:metallophosphoesterase [Woeseiaceae bacterium]
MDAAHVLNSIKRRLTVILFVLFLAPAAFAEDGSIEGVGRVVAISDVHGAYDAMVATLQNVEVLDDDLNWVGGATHLVIVGDLLDRGPRSRDAMDLMMRLEDEAESAGGRVHVLIGNHEMMNMIGDLRYVSKAEYAAFAGDETSRQRDRWFTIWAARRGGASTLLRERFDSTFPRGYFALSEAFSADGKYGRWLLEKPIIAVINRTAFVHGGLPPAVIDMGLAGVNEGLKKNLATYVRAVGTLIDAGVLLPTDSFYDHERIVTNYVPSLDETHEVLGAIKAVQRLSDSAVLSSRGPLWYRGNVACSGLIEEHRLEDALESIGADRVIVGHTPTPNRKVLQRFDGRVVEVDTGMLNFYYKGSGNALVLEDGALLVHNQDGSAPYAPLSHPREVGARPGDLSPEQLQTLLEVGDIVSEATDDETGRTLVRVSDGNHTVSALFASRGGKGFYPDVAAYRLDRLLDLEMVPVTAVRTVNGKDGSLQFVPERRSDEAQRSSSGRGGSAPCSLPSQWDAMYVFDTLIHNEGRSLQRMLYEPSNWSLILVEHERAFKATKMRPPHLKSAELAITDGWREALSALSDNVLNEQLGDVLDRRRLRSLGKRRDELLKQ